MVDGWVSAVISKHQGPLFESWSYSRPFSVVFACSRHVCGFSRRVLIGASDGLVMRPGCIHCPESLI